MGIHKSTAFRLLSALESRGMVQQNMSRGKYQVGVGVLRLASSMSRRISIVQQARPTLEQLADDLAETVNLAVRRSTYAVNVDQAMGPVVAGHPRLDRQPDPAARHRERQDPDRRPAA